jgi:hypothetical protein
MRDLGGSLTRLRQRHRVARAGDAETRAVEVRIAALLSEIARIDGEKSELLARRHDLQQTLGASIGRDRMALSRVEKTNGVPSFVAGMRMMQRIHRKAANPTHGLDGAGEVFASRARTEEFVRSHGVPLAVAPEPGPADRRVVVHAFHGLVGLVEVRVGDGVRHLDGAGEPLGDIRPALTHDPELGIPASLARLTDWAETLSDAISRPYAQIVWQQDEDRLVIDRIDVDPDRIPVLVEDEDERLGWLFERGHARMLKQPFLLGALENRVPDGVFDPDPALDRGEQE